MEPERPLERQAEEDGLAYPGQAQKARELRHRRLDDDVFDRVRVARAVVEEVAGRPEIEIMDSDDVPIASPEKPPGRDQKSSYGRPSDYRPSPHDEHGTARSKKGQLTLRNQCSANVPVLYLQEDTEQLPAGSIHRRGKAE